jgi:nucleoside-diphosphate-sugar epimerase
LLDLIKKFTKSKNPITLFEKDYICHNFLPSVECGPISIHKIQAELGFTPMPLEEAIESAVNFCMDAIRLDTYPVEVADAKASLLKLLSDSSSSD